MDTAMSPIWIPPRAVWIPLCHRYGYCHEQYGYRYVTDMDTAMSPIWIPPRAVWIPLCEQYGHPLCHRYGYRHEQYRYRYVSSMDTRYVTDMDTATSSIDTAM
eukprot:Blabericola_migrator_1__7761@NODE_396_length_8973_cov_12_789355_g315_i0_p4_GENE_NODE_396_length_8973_cov_12_789355_g315_i0NODE_396_length_8973_cov_12_789355_g315_i0_p4_ORF_typecomplete_len103_score5_89DUF1281_C/PF18406_1/27DUF1281_C/PF18406_1/1DUF3046/PF11248_8/29DUF3046/PF11248_8/4_9_NODE_396_length_8973_cov_12_789355_g315_i072627570